MMGYIQAFRSLFNNEITDSWYYLYRRTIPNMSHIYTLITATNDDIS